MTAATRIEHDLLGDRAVPAQAYYGVHTLRALENFPISGTPISIYPDLVAALACVKQAAAMANAELGMLDVERAQAIRLACEEVRAGGLLEEFVVDVIQGGAGTSTNMNANEVICNRALELLGRARGDYAHLHPLDHVNMSQSTNDVYPTAVKLALQLGIRRLLAEMRALRGAFEAKAAEFADVLKVGRTQLQDAVPMTLGQEFSAYAVMIGEDESRLAEAAALVREINLGATAIGTGLNAHPDYAPLATQRLSEISGLAFIVSPNLVEATQDAGAFVQLSGVLKRVAVKLSKICNDLRLLSSGPRAGIGEISLPAVQAGSSIMPGKVNPVIPEVVNQIAFEAIGNDVTVTLAAEGRPAAAECLRADHRAQPVREPDAPRRGLPHARRALRERHRGQSRARAAPARRFHRPGRCAQSPDRLRARKRGGAGRAGQRAPRLRPRARARLAVARRARRAAQARGPDPAAGRRGASPPRRGIIGAMQPMWQPSEEAIEQAQLTQFARHVVRKHKLDLNTYPDFYRWTVDEPEAFWNEVWEWCGVRASRKGTTVLADGDKMPGAKWFPEARLNFAENLLRRGDRGDAFVFWDERGPQRRVSYSDLTSDVSRAAQALAQLGCARATAPRPSSPTCPRRRCSRLRRSRRASSGPRARPISASTA
jgi:aspartate ammonia-lyase